jgi:chromosome partitioning protein
LSAKRRRGKTTLAINLAAAAEQSGFTALVIDTDPQATASQWSAWRQGLPPEVIDSAPPRIAAKVEAARAQGARTIVIDTPPHADTAATRAVEVADLVLIPCRPSAFDLAAIKTTVQLVKLLGKQGWVVFTAGPSFAPRMYEATALINSFGISVCPHILSDRAAYRHASAAGKTVLEFEPHGRAAGKSHSCTRGHVHMRSSHMCACGERRDEPVCKSRRQAGGAGYGNAKSAGTSGAPPAELPPSRVGRKVISGYFSPEMSLAMHMCARRAGVSLQALMAEAFNDVLRKYGDSPVGE